jgi:spore germination cell wall hydrolase CwlJ-like protein
MKSTEARRRAEKLAALMLAGHPRTKTDGATYFHTRAVRPGWAHRMTRTATIGHHYFYRASTQVASN